MNITRRKLLGNGLGLGALGILAGAGLFNRDTAIAAPVGVTSAGALAAPQGAQTGEADYYVMDGTVGEDTATYRVVLHIATPGGTNLAGLSWAACVAQDPRDKVSKVPWVSATRQTQLTNGLAVEVVRSLKVSTHDGNAAKQTRLEALYLAAVSIVQAEIKDRYWAWGFERA